MRKLGTSLIIFIISAFFFSTSLYAAPKFGDTPTTDTLNSASANKATAGITTNNLAAIVFSVTWPEVTGNNTSLTPSPMTIGRADVSTSNGTKLWADGQVNSTYKYVRAHWSAGVGVWQLDSSGLGADVAFQNSVLTDTASSIVASEMARLYKSATGTAADKRKAAWGPWFGCGTGKTKCETIYNTLYNSSTDVISITRDSTVSRGGGIVSKTCYNTATPSVTWSCYKFNASVAQGHTGSWNYAPLNGSSSLEPVPLPFLTYWKADTSGNKTEYRHWLKADTGYDTSKWASRPFGTNARNSVVWQANSPLGAY